MRCVLGVSEVEKNRSEREQKKMSVEEAEPPQYIVTAPGEENDDDDDDRSSTTTTTSTATTVNAGTGTTVNVTKIKSHNTRSHSLQSSSTSSTGHFVDQSASLSNATLMQQLKAHSSMNIVSEKHTVQKFTTTSTSSSSGATKSKFTSFLQHPDSTVSSHGATFLTAQQKHVRQFVRSTSAHSSTESANTAKCIRSASQQHDDGFDHSLTIEHAKGFHQSAAILISKSAEAIEGMKLSCSAGAGNMRTQLTLSGGLLAPPNRKLTILSPVHAPPGLQELLKKHRSPLSPRISFPGTDTELFP